jgi:hypothetical protein
MSKRQRCSGIADADTSGASEATRDIRRLPADWTTKAAVGVIVTVIAENKANLAGGGGVEL